MKQEIEQQSAYWNSEVHAFDSIYTTEKSDFSKWLDKVFRWDMYARFEYTMKKSEPIKDRNILDVGCGTGLFSLEYARRNAKMVTGIDIAEKMIAVCKERAEKEHLSSNCEFIETDLLEFSPKNKFDICIGIGLFDYIKNPQEVITKMHNVVDDCVIMTFPRFWTWRAPVRKARLGLRNCSVYFYTKSRLKKLLEKAGFKHYEIESVGKIFCVTAYVG
jgi:2-polyprenyl-3-methyl-5-hydroxy-6-metoxy-1,4-benzoquinol methylase